jgi:hypothetical protein
LNPTTCDSSTLRNIFIILTLIYWVIKKSKLLLTFSCSNTTLLKMWES